VRLLVTGGAGYLGSELCLQAAVRGDDVLAGRHLTPPPHGRPLQLDVRDAEAVERAFLRHGPDVVIHTAYVPGGPELESTIIRGTHAVAVAAARIGARLVSLSTDLVFDGEHGAPYGEDADPRPVMAYGAAKLEAERLTLREHPDALVVRTSVLYGKPEPGPQELLALRDDVDFYTDEIRCPTLVAELATALLELGARAEPHGVLHLAAPDAVSRLELARRLRTGLGGDSGVLRGRPSPRGARARNVALDSSRAAKTLGRSLTGIRSR
jgi:dTDP-4-dehydrorhamnose reductase